MTRLSSRLTARIKGTEVLDRALRYNSRHYGLIGGLLRGLDGMDRSARRDMSSRLTRRALEWAADTPSGLPAHVPLSDRPHTEKADVRDHPERFRSRGLIRARASSSGSTGIPVQLQRSLRSIASEQAFIDDLLGVWSLTFRTARIARLRADHVKPVTDREPPFGIRTHDGRQLLLSSNHLSPTTAGWFHDELRRFAPDVLYTHPSSGEALARFMQRGTACSYPYPWSSRHPSRCSPRDAYSWNTYFRPRSSIITGKPSGWHSRRALPKVLRTSIPCTAGSSSCRSTKPEAPPGCRALEIVGTGFWNDAMPLVRYRTGDRAIVPGHFDVDELEDVTLGLRPVLAIQGRAERLISREARYWLASPTPAMASRGWCGCRLCRSRWTRCGCWSSIPESDGSMKPN